MESTEKELIETFALRDLHIKRLYDEHLFLDQKISSFEGRVFLSERDQAEIQTLKKKKLRGKEMLIRLIEEHRARAL